MHAQVIDFVHLEGMELVQQDKDLAGCQLVEDIDMYNRVHEMFNIFSASDSRQHDDAEGFR
jgi:hypothetical protein